MSHIIRKSPELVSIARQNLYKSLSSTGTTNTTNWCSTTNTTNTTSNTSTTSSTSLYYSRLTLPIQQVIRFAGLAPEPFGHQAERLLIRELGLQPRTAHDHDGILELTGHRIEIKCARYQISNRKYKSMDLTYKSMDLKYKSLDLTYKSMDLTYKWTRINPRAGFDLLLLALLDWNGFVIRILDRQQVIDLAQQIINTRGQKNNMPEKQMGKFVIHRDDLLGVKPSI